MNNIFIEKLNKEMKQSEVVLYREQQRYKDEEFSINNFAAMDVSGLA